MTAFAQFPVYRDCARYFFLDHILSRSSEHILSVTELNSERIKKHFLTIRDSPQLVAGSFNYALQNIGFFTVENYALGHE
jgi:hypothetical protein